MAVLKINSEHPPDGCSCVFVLKYSRVLLEVAHFKKHR